MFVDSFCILWIRPQQKALKNGISQSARSSKEDSGLHIRKADTMRRAPLDPEDISQAMLDRSLVHGLFSGSSPMSSRKVGRSEQDRH